MECANGIKKYTTKVNSQCVYVFLAGLDSHLDGLRGCVLAIKPLPDIQYVYAMVKVDLLSTDGEVTASPSYPCMLQFKSQLIRYIETFLRSFPLLTGYSSESQIISIKMKGFTEGNEPTSCLKVILEQRAKYRAGSGITKIYEASLILESEPPLVKKILCIYDDEDDGEDGDDENEDEEEDDDNDEDDD
ncbi:hypothetical protein IFM89_000240 [Coptis chinensis]|uniref:Uncharacterized protein n=1 Tax=Coptis chinensis TaxID=261450 RepID=A0A835IJ96_9MAGN|nr:hypothetical protein IFM89_000240 [Coptis chinensis]